MALYIGKSSTSLVSGPDLRGISIGNDPYSSKSSTSLVPTQMNFWIDFHQAYCEIVKMLAFVAYS